MRTATRVQRAVLQHAKDDGGDVTILHGRAGEWRLRVGDWRVRFVREGGDGRERMLVLRVLNRRDAYD